MLVFAEWKQNRTKTSKVTSIDIQKYGHMLLLRFNHLFTLRSLNSEWKKPIDNTPEWSTFHLANEDTKKYGTDSWESQSTFTMLWFQENLKIFSKHSQITKPSSLSNLRHMHITDLEILRDKLHWP
jgi:hypothetical protein